MLTKQISGVVYKKFIEYAISKSDYFALIMLLHSKVKYEENLTINAILNDKKFTKFQIINNYSKKMFNKIYNKYKNNVKIIDFYTKALDKSYELIKKQFIDSPEDLDFFFNLKEKEKITFQSIDNDKYGINNIAKMNVYLTFIDWYIYTEKGKKVLKKYNECIFSIKDNYYDNFIYQSYKEIKFKINKKTRLFLLHQVNNIFAWCYPKNLDDLCFCKNDVCWFYTVSHEKICDIYCENEEEYNYLKSIGIEFYEDHYVKEEPLLYDEFKKY